MPYQDQSDLDIIKSGQSKRPNKFFQEEYVIFDFETTGFKASDCCIIEVGAAKIKSGKIVETFWSFVHPTHPIPPEITRITSITNNDVAHAPLWEEIVPDFHKFTLNTTLVAHNASFDMAFLEKQSEPAGYYFRNPVLDTIALAKSKIHLTSYKLNVLLEHLNLHNTNPHRALHDAISTAKMFIVLSTM
jgi:DNA polymerase-3 subunit alpha (Gram-positive type)